MKPFTLWFFNMNGPFIGDLQQLHQYLPIKMADSPVPQGRFLDTRCDLAAATVATEVEDTLAEDDLVLAPANLGFFWDLMG